jgi:hypothetical protein
MHPSAVTKETIKEERASKANEQENARDRERTAALPSSLARIRGNFAPVFDRFASDATLSVR